VPSLFRLRARRCGDQEGKLKAAAQAWARGRGGGKRAETDALTAAAALPDWVERPATADRPIEIGPDEVDAVALFTALGTQWIWHPTVGVRLGIRYEAVAPTAEGLGLKMTPALFADLLIMEAAAIEAAAARP